MVLLPFYEKMVLLYLFRSIFFENVTFVSEKPKPKYGSVVYEYPLPVGTWSTYIYVGVSFSSVHVRLSREWRENITINQCWSLQNQNEIIGFCSRDAIYFRSRILKLPAGRYRETMSEEVLKQSSQLNNVGR